MARNFNEIIAEVDHGNLHHLLSEALEQVSAGVLETNKAGSLTLTLKLKVNKDNQIFMDSEVKKKVPEQGVATSLFFADENGSLSRRDPKQGDMFQGVQAVK